MLFNGFPMFSNLLSHDFLLQPSACVPCCSMQSLSFHLHTTPWMDLTLTYFLRISLYFSFARPVLVCWATFMACRRSCSCAEAATFTRTTKSKSSSAPRSSTPSTARPTSLRLAFRAAATPRAWRPVFLFRGIPQRLRLQLLEQQLVAVQEDNRHQQRLLQNQCARL